MKLDITKFPPAWCKDAIATPRGWAHPTTGEILVALKGIKAELWKSPYQDAEFAMIDEVVTEPVIDEFGMPLVTIDEKVETTAPVDEVVTEPATLSEQPATNESPEPKRRGRPRKDGTK